MKNKTIIMPLLTIISTIILLSGCKQFDPLMYLADNVQITWKGEEATDKQPIDSIVVKSQPIYWKEIDNSFMIDSIEYETDFIKDGYRVWQLRTPNWKRVEVQRLDTVIYIYKK